MKWSNNLVFSSRILQTAHLWASTGVVWNVESTTSYIFQLQTGGIFYFPRHRHQIEWTDGFVYLFRKDLAKRGKRNCQSAASRIRPRTRLVLKCGLAHLNANANAGDESNASANANAEQLNQMQMQMQMRSS